jgi:hypothetical protein
MKTLTDELAVVMREWLPALVTESKDFGRETVQTVVWLVGLATGLITLLATHSGTIEALTISQRRVLIPVLAATITCGLLQRILNQLVERKERILLFGLQGHLAAYGTQHAEPDELNEQSTPDEESKRLNDLLQVLAAYGLYDPVTAMLAPTDTLRMARKQVLTIRRLRRVGFWLFVLACVPSYSRSCCWHMQSFRNLVYGDGPNKSLDASGGFLYSENH